MIREQWDFPLLESMTEFWTEYPPLYAMVAHHIGIKPKAAKTTAQPDLSEFFANVEQKPNKP